MTDDIRSDLGPFCILPRWVLRNPRVDAYDMAVFCVLADHADRDGVCFPSHSTIASIAGCSERKVRDSLENLRAEGAVSWSKKTRVDGGLTSNSYIVHYVDPSAPHAAPPAHHAGGVSAHHAGGDRHTMPGKKNQEEEEPVVEEEPEKPLSEDAQRVWDAYLAACETFDPKRRKPKATKKRKDLIARRLKEYSVDDLILAVSGWLHSDHHIGKNAQGKVWNDLGLLLRNDEKIEMFIDYHNSKKPSADSISATWGSDEEDLDAIYGVEPTGRDWDD